MFYSFEKANFQHYNMKEILAGVAKKRPNMLPFIISQLQIWFLTPVYNEKENEIGGVGTMRFVQIVSFSIFLGKLLFKYILINYSNYLII